MKLPKFFPIFIFLQNFAFCSGEFVTCKFSGQLGNQMFEIANVVAFALEHHCHPVFPDLFYAEYGQENYENVFFRIDTSNPNVNFTPYHYEFTMIDCWRYIQIPYTPGCHLQMSGLFQSEKYFKKYSASIRRLFAPQKTLIKNIFEKYGQLLKKDSPTVAVHIRTFIPDGRDPSTNKNFWNYFLKAINYFPKNYKFLIFSDDINYVKEHLPPINRITHFIEGNSKYFDLYLISLCAHQIVSPHSTFSWWGAWLNRNPNKTVIVLSDPCTCDYYPKEWIKLEKGNL